MAWGFPSLLKDYINNYQSLPIPHTRVCGSDFMCLFACERATTNESLILSAMCTRLFGRKQTNVLVDENNRE